MKKFKLLPLLLILSLFVSVLSVPALALTGPEMAGMSAVATDAATGQVLFDKSSDMSVEAGGMTFLMTALLAGEAVDRQDIFMDDAVVVTATGGYNLGEGAVLADPALAEGESLTVEDLLYLMLFGGAQDAANVLAEYVGGSIDAFVASMNARAAELGCTGTNFVNTNGVSANGHFTTAQDIARIAKAVFENATLRPVLQAPNHTTAATEVNAPRTVTNPNSLTSDESGLKYEHTTAGLPVLMPMGWGIVAAATYNEITVIAVTLGCVDDATRCTDMGTLFRWVYENYGFQTLLSSTDILDTVPVSMGDPEAVGVRAETGIRIMRANDQPLGEITHKITYQHETDGTTLTAPIEVGAYLGDVTVYMDGVEYGTSRLVAASSVEISRSQYLHSQLDVLMQSESVRQIIKILIIVLGVYLLLVCFYLLQRVRHLHSLRKARKERARARSQQEIEWLDLGQETPESAEPSGYIRQEAGDRPGPEGEDGEYPDGEGEYPDESGEYADEDGEYAEEDGEYAEEDGEYADEDGEYADEDGEYADEDGEYAGEDGRDDGLRY